MRFNILSIFPEFFNSPLSCGLLGKARERGIVDFSLLNPREYSLDKHSKVDDRPFGGGPGMVMSVEPLLRALSSLPEPGRLILLSPQGRKLDQDLAAELAREQNLTLVCGRYEGVDARFQEVSGAEEVSLGDFVLSGGESAALCLVEAVSRLQPEFMGCQESSQEESFASGLLEHAQYTRPDVYQGLQVPEVLLSGDHQKIAQWRRQDALQKTLRLRPELLGQARLNVQDQAYLRQIPRLRPGRGLYLALVHYPVLNKDGRVTAVSLTNLDIHDIARVCCTYGLGGYFLVTPLKDQQELADRLLQHWTLGAGGRRNPDRLQAMQKVRVVDSVQEARELIQESTGQEPLLLGSSARSGAVGISCQEVKRVLRQRPVLLLLGTAHGLAREVLEDCDAQLPPIRFLEDYNHLSVRSAASIIVDRVLGDFF
ncbi:MAG: tRNA (guanosine(37)-N1)-methyltransferase TrmD [Desulfohalobiaceae bacterium]